uniref:Uncharacterized protein n=1 Tax=Panagrellus redivivus TaxID=6233 RepID=A0A7E4W4W9_PANRE
MPCEYTYGSFCQNTLLGIVGSVLIFSFVSFILACVVPKDSPLRKRMQKPSEQNPDYDAPPPYFAATYSELLQYETAAHPAEPPKYTN